MKRAVRAHTRKHGSQGVFEDRFFEVEAPTQAHNGEVRELWFQQFGPQWELHHFVNLPVTAQERFSIDHRMPFARSSNW